MRARLREYRPESDFLRVRGLLADEYERFHATTCWRVERWVYARHFVAPMLGASRFAQTAEDAARGIVNWESEIGVWEDDSGRVVGVVHGESDGPGRVFLQRRLGADELLEEMIGFGTRVLGHPDTGEASLYVPDADAAFRSVAAALGFGIGAGQAEHESCFDCSQPMSRRLPEGFCIRSMAEQRDVEPRRQAMGRGFDHTEPGEWPAAVCYHELQLAPGYRSALDLCVTAPDGQYVASCIGWYDSANRTGALEPVCTVPEYRRRGLGREVVYEAIRRMQALGARTVWVGTDKPFYLAIGFRVCHTAHYWCRRE